MISLFLRTLCLLLMMAPLSYGAQLSEDQFTVDFHPDDRRVAESSLQYLLEARDEFSARLPLGEERVKVRIAHDMDEFQGLTGIYAHVNVSGVARSDKGDIVLKSPRLRSIDEDYRGTVRHELIHILLYRNTNTDHLPRWLNEGICMFMSNEVRWQSPIQVTRMHLTGKIIPIQSLDMVFQLPGSDRQFGDAYAQALSMTRHLHDALGEEKFWAVVDAMNTQSFEQAMASVGGLPVSEFWRDYSGGLWGLSIITTLRTGSFWGVIAFLCILAFGMRHIRNRRIIQRWEEEEKDAAPDAFDWDHILEDAEAWKRGGSDQP